MSVIPQVISAASTIVDAGELASIHGTKITRFFNRRFKRKIRVLVYGDSGVGKTQFLNTLTGKNTYSFHAPERTRQLQHYSLMLASGRRVEFIDTPGHKSYAFQRESALHHVVKGKVDGIINLVDFGYQDSELVQKKPEDVFQAGTSTVKAEYLRNNRKLEIDRTKELVKTITPDVKLKWFLTVINKADVWHTEREAVIDYYVHDEYNEMVQPLAHATHMAIAPFCSVITPFGNKEMKLTYSERDKRMDYKALVMALEEFIQDKHGD